MIIKSIEKIELLKNDAEKLQAALFKVENDIYKEEEKLPYIYGRCIKQLICHHQSDYHKADDETTISIGDVILFFKYPHSKYTSVNVNSWEYFHIPYSEEYFDFFTSNDDVDHREFYRD